MIAALMVVFAVASFGLIHVQLDLARAKEQRATVDAQRAFYMAEAGLAEAFQGVASGKSGNVGTPEEPARFANGIFFTTADESDDGRITLTSTGLCGAGRATVAIVIERVSESTAALGFFGDDLVTVEAGATVDSYDSRSGPYTPLSASSAGAAQIGCNGDVTVGGNALSPTKIYGDARPGPDGLLTKSRQATITGTTAPFLTAKELPAVEVPSLPLRSNVSTTLLSPAKTLPGGEGSYNELRVGALGKMTIHGPAKLVVGQLQVDATGELVLNSSGGPIELYVTNRLQLAALSKITTPGADSRGVTLSITAPPASGTAIPLSSTGKFYGTIVAPATGLTVGSAFEVFGALAADRLTISAGARMHFDVALLSPDASEGTLPVFLGWQLVELPNVAIVKLREDALGSLQEAGVTVRSSSDSHFDLGELVNTLLGTRR